MNLRSSIALLLCGVSGLASAEVKLPALFSDHAVLQRDASVPVWGWAAAGEEVTVSIAGQIATAKAGADGKWTTKLANLGAGGPYKLEVKGSNTITVNDVLIGDVWLGSGQSNMAMNVKAAQNFEAEQAKSNLPQMRMFTVGGKATPEPQNDVEGKWQVCTPDTVGGFSATLFFTCREIYNEIKLPVGMINSSVGGTPIESWIDSKAQHAKPELKGFFEGMKNEKFDAAGAKALYDKQVAAWNEAVKKARAEHKELPRKPRDPLATRERKGDVGGLFNGKINGLIPYAIKGALWYQGEANSQPGKSQYYNAQLSLLVTDWRQRWGYDFPFAWVQLPNFGGGRADAWCQVREGMFQTLSLPKTGMATTIDIGEEKNIHPKNKQEVGRRLAQWALGTVYGKKVAISGPRFTGSEVKGGEIALSFSHTDGGLVFKGEPKGFVVAGEDKQWHEASAKIDSDKVVLSSKEVATPVAVRYAWHEMPPCTLWNGAGLPASPFRTDTWPLNYDASTRVIKVACVGDSITEGVGAKDKKTGTYPAQLQMLLGSGYQVRNFGVSARTMLKNGDHPYEKEQAFKDAVAFKPDIVTILLGTNDSKPQNWAHKADFADSARTIVNAFKKANPRVRIHICLPIPAYPENFGITEKVISAEVIPALKKFARDEKLRTIDLHKPMEGQIGNVPDKVHPNDIGYRTMAAVLAKALTGKEPNLDVLPSLEPGARR
jgi:sialate O-acetylesterase